MTSIVQQGLSFGSWPTFPSSNPTIIDLRVIDRMSSPVWWEAKTNIKSEISFESFILVRRHRKINLGQEDHQASVKMLKFVEYTLHKSTRELALDLNISQSITLACDVLKVEYVKTDFKADFYAESKSYTHLF